MSKQRAHQIAGEPGVPRADRAPRPKEPTKVGSARGDGMGEAVAPREALAMTLGR